VGNNLSISNGIEYSCDKSMILIIMMSIALGFLVAFKV
jgi:hypothetical protein